MLPTIIALPMIFSERDSASTQFNRTEWSKHKHTKRSIKTFACLIFYLFIFFLHSGSYSTAAATDALCDNLLEIVYISVD